MGTEYALGTVTFSNCDTGEVLFTTENASLESITEEINNELTIKQNNKLNFRTCEFEIDNIDPTFIDKLIGIQPSDNKFKVVMSGIYQYKVQNRKHKQKRINKKWLKRYGYTMKGLPIETTYHNCSVNKEGNIEAFPLSN